MIANYAACALVTAAGAVGLLSVPAAAASTALAPGRQGSPPPVAAQAGAPQVQSVPPAQNAAPQQQNGSQAQDATSQGAPQQNAAQVQDATPQQQGTPQRQNQQNAAAADDRPRGQTTVNIKRRYVRNTHVSANVNAPEPATAAWFGVRGAPGQADPTEQLVRDALSGG